MRLFISLMALVFSSVAVAHPGHDHSHWISNFVHLGFALSIAGAIGLGVFLWKRKGQIRRKEEQ